jgi:hypothetical protein
MDEGLFREGGPFRVSRISPEEYEMAITIPPGDDGLVGRMCPNETCAPAYFRVRPGTGITTQQASIHCPYCRAEADPSRFVTAEQRNHAIEVVKAEAVKGISRLLGDALGVTGSGRRTLGGGLVSIEMSMRPAAAQFSGRLVEDELRRDVTCPKCGLNQAVFGLATWCSDCGEDIFPAHFSAEFKVLRKVLGAVEERRLDLGARIAARDVENALEDLVSVVEAVLKVLARRWLVGRGLSVRDADDVFQRDIRNGFQSLPRARELLRAHTGAELGREFSPEALEALAAVLEKRHPIAHNLGVVDRQYLLRARTGELEGREVLINADELIQAVALVETMLTDAWTQLFNPPKIS